MSTDMLAALQSLDRDVLNTVVRQDQRSATFEVLDWTVERFHFLQVQDSTGGLYVFRGNGRDGDDRNRPWAVVLKILKKLAVEGDPRDLSYWKRELLAFQSGLLADIPSAVRVPRCYGTTEKADSGWIWIEYIQQVDRPENSLESFRLAAHQVGLFGGAYLMGKPLPDYPWLSNPLLYLLKDPTNFWTGFLNPESEQSAWRSPIVQKAFPDVLRVKSQQVGSALAALVQAMDRLPQVLCHNDYSRRNMVIRTRPDGQDEVVALDWAWVGIGAIGLDAGWLVSGSMFLLVYEPMEAAQLEVTVLEAYLAGLREAGWTGDERMVRFGFLVTAIGWAYVLPGWAAMLLGEGSLVDTMAIYGRSAEQVAAAWATMTEFLAERLETTLALMHELKLE